MAGGCDDRTAFCRKHTDVSPLIKPLCNSYSYSMTRADFVNFLQKRGSKSSKISDLHDCMCVFMCMCQLDIPGWLQLPVSLRYTHTHTHTHTLLQCRGLLRHHVKHTHTHTGRPSSVFSRVVQWHCTDQKSALIHSNFHSKLSVCFTVGADVCVSVIV